VVRRQLGKGDKNKIRGIYNRAAYWAERLYCSIGVIAPTACANGAPAVSLRRSAA